MMNNFLNLIKFYISMDPSLINSNLSNFIYTQLISFNLRDDVVPLVNKEDLFELWIQRYKNNPNVNVFVNDKRPYFCQFVNTSTSIAKNEIKLYNSFG